MSERYPYVCPACRGELSAKASSMSCSSCRLAFSVDQGIADFARGDHRDRYDASTELSEEDLANLRSEDAGTRSRIHDFYLPKLRKLQARLEGLSDSFRVLDCGCGNGLSVDLLRSEGVEAWGIDLSLLRRWQWRERAFPRHLALASGCALPFPDGFFAAVVSSGVLEHIGVTETSQGGYRVEVLPERDRVRTAFLGELMRVTRPGGTIWLDFPNGAFPIDFWHGDRAGGARFHSPGEGFLPTFRELEAYVRDLSREAGLRAVSPHGRLALRQVRRHWYGAALHLPAKTLLRAMEFPFLRFLARTPLNPYIVAEIRRA